MIAGDAFRSQRDVLIYLLQHNLTYIANKLYTKSIISRSLQTRAMNQLHDPIDRTVSLLSVVEDKIRTEPYVFTELVAILESEPKLRSPARELVEQYCQLGMMQYYNIGNACRKLF